MNVSRTEKTRDDWQTPDHVLEIVRGFFDGWIDYDPCSALDNPTDAARWGVPPEDYAGNVPFIIRDGFARPWGEFGQMVFCNPPFAAKIRNRALDMAAEHAAQAWKYHAIVLTPANVGAKWYQDRVFAKACAVCFVRGRLTFKGAPAPAMFDTSLTYYGQDGDRFSNKFSKLGAIWRP